MSEKTDEELKEVAAEFVTMSDAIMSFSTANKIACVVIARPDGQKGGWVGSNLDQEQACYVLASVLKETRPDLFEIKYLKEGAKNEGN